MPRASEKKSLSSTSVSMTKPEPVESQIRDALQIDAEEEFCRGKGCPKCHGTGYNGRRSVYELLTVTDDIRCLINDGVSAREIERAAVAAGMNPMDLKRGIDLAVDRVVENLKQTLCDMHASKCIFSNTNFSEVIFDFLLSLKWK